MAAAREGESATAGDGSGAPPSPLHRLLKAERGELAPALLGAGQFFCLLLGYFLLRPVREGLGVERGVEHLRWLFVGTAVVSLVVSLGFGGLVGRCDRRRFIAISYRLVIACLGVFLVLWLGGGGTALLVGGYAFYIWLSVVNMFVTAVFWGFMADVWTADQARRLFAFIAVGGTLGAVVGSSATWWLAERAGVAGMLALAAVALEASVRLMYALDRRSRGRNGPLRPHVPHAVGGPSLEGAAQVARSPYLLAIAGYLVLMAVSSTLLYFTQARLVTDATEALTGRIALFAQLDIATQSATLLVQLFVTSRLLARVGTGATLALLPLITLAGFLVLARLEVAGGSATAIFTAFAIFQAAHAATRHAVARPARETLFSVLGEREKYKAKAIVDVFLYRAGDVAGMGVEAALARAALGSLAAMTLAVAPLAAVWLGLSVALGVAQRRRAAALAPPQRPESLAEAPRGAPIQGAHA